MFDSGYDAVSFPLTDQITDDLRADVVTSQGEPSLDQRSNTNLSTDPSLAEGDTGDQTGELLRVFYTFFGLPFMN